MPQPIWRLPAALLAMLRMLADPSLCRVAGPALQALNHPDNFFTRWRFAWGICYAYEANLILGMQMTRITKRWVLDHIIVEGRLPTDGAVLLPIHQTNSRLAGLRLRAAGLSLGLIAADGTGATAREDPGYEQWLKEHGVTQPLISGVHAARQRTYQGNIFVPPHAARPGRHWLLQGNSLVIAADTFAGTWPRCAILDRAMPIPPGAVWFAKQTDKPIVPFVICPRGKRWVLWIGEPVQATAEGVAAGMESCIRQAPVSWTSMCWRAWSEMPSWKDDGVKERG